MYNYCALLDKDLNAIRRVKQVIEFVFVFINVSRLFCFIFNINHTIPVVVSVLHVRHFIQKLTKLYEAVFVKDMCNHIYSSYSSKEETIFVHCYFLYKVFFYSQLRVFFCLNMLLTKLDVVLTHKDIVYTNKKTCQR